MRIAVVPERYGNVVSPCASIRITSFLGVLARVRGWQVRYLLASEVESFRPDVLVWHRAALADVDEVERMWRLAQRAGFRLTYDLDDNLLDMAGHGEAEAYRSSIEAVSRSLQVADQVWCSTPTLAARCGVLTRRVPHVLPNALDPDLWGSAPAVPTSSAVGRLRLLYMGTRTHDDDLALLVDAISMSGLGERGELTLTTVGVRARESALEPWQGEIQLPAHIGASYPAFVHWFRTLRGYDAGVAPLMSGRFNDCKSPIKVLDYAAIGLGTIASDMPAYADVAADGRCVLVHNSAEAWAEALTELVTNRAPLLRAWSAASHLIERSQHGAAVEARGRLLEDVLL